MPTVVFSLRVENWGQPQVPRSISRRLPNRPQARPRFSTGRLALVLWASFVAADRAAGDDTKPGPGPPSAKAAPDKTFQKVAAKFRQRSHSAKPADRIASLALLADYPGAEAASLVYDTLLANNADDVRQAAVEFLIGWRDRNDVADKLLSRMSSATRKDGMSTRTVAALQALGGTEDGTLQKRLLAYLDEFLGTAKSDQFRLHEMIDERAGKPDALESLRMLRLFTQTKYFDRNFGFRRCVMQGIIQVREADAITDLIGLLPRVSGQVEFDVVSHLVATTGQDFDNNEAKWIAWWRENRERAVLRDSSPSKSFRNYGEFGEYYGIPICAKRVVFVLDTSNSMRGAKIDAAKTALVRAIHDLKQDVFFNVIAFNGRVRVWQSELAPASEPMKGAAVNMVLEQPLAPLTASYDALEAAFGLDPEAIYFLSDGAPVGGKIVVPDEIVATISRVNRVRRVSLHSIGIATGDGKRDVFGRFMKGLATANWGVYKAVN